ncbi:MAG: hypothetical protein R3F07_12815 [Opitutaceae bacterium]
MSNSVNFGLFVLLSLLGASKTIGDTQPDHRSYELLRVIEVEGRQGVATNGTNYFVGGNTSLFIYSKSGELVGKNETALDDLPHPGNHIGDICFHNGELFAVVEWFEDFQGKDIQVAVYDARTLLYLRSIPWEPASGQIEVSGVAIDAGDNSIWLTDW